MQIISLGNGSKLIIKGEEYTLHQIPNDGGYQLMGSDGKYKLGQCFYCADMPTPERVEAMALKYLVA